MDTVYKVAIGAGVVLVAYLGFKAYQNRQAQTQSVDPRAQRIEGASDAGTSAFSEFTRGVTSLTRSAQDIQNMINRQNEIDRARQTTNAVTDKQYASSSGVTTGALGTEYKKRI